MNPTDQAEPVRATVWRVRVRPPRGKFAYSQFTYPAPIDARGVRTTPAVIAWAERLGGKIEEIEALNRAL